MKKGFTLAEVLITLGIIGVVAALTIPTLVSKYQKTQYITQLKKAYSQFNEALKLMSNDMGCPNDLKCTGLFVNSESLNLSQYEKEIGDSFIKYFKVIKNCELELNAGCLPSSVYDFYDGSGAPGSYDDWENWYKFITADGSAWALYGFDGCPDTGPGHMEQWCGYASVDVNGPGKGPNVLGRDLFNFYITNGKGAQLYPVGGIDNIEYTGWWRNSNAEGDYKSCYEDNKYANDCAGRVMEEGWQMNY